MTHTEFADSLTQIADFFERHPELPLPDLNYFTVYDWGETAKEMVVRAARALGTCEKQTNSNITFGVYKDFGGIILRFLGGKGQVCTKRVVGTRHIEQQYIPSSFVEAYEEEIFEWDCPGLLEPSSKEEAVWTVERDFKEEEAPATMTNSPDSFCSNKSLETKKVDG